MPKEKFYLDIKYEISDDDSGLKLDISTTDGSKLTPQDILDAVMSFITEIGGAEIKPIDKESLANDEKLH